MLNQRHTASGTNENAVLKKKKFLNILTSLGVLLQGCKSPRPNIAVAVTFCTAVSNICRFFPWNLLNVIWLTHKILRWPLDFCITCASSILITSNEMQQYAGIYLLQNCSTCFGCLSHPSTLNCNCSFWYRSYHVSEQQPSASTA